ncbi:hypothetical protein AB6866_04365 [Rahnella inusitata]|uniref:hypothetical protein n=1 Tax=Rahnella inusitata TaxID=58169 RepID=UPI0039BE2C73
MEEQNTFNTEGNMNRVLIVDDDLQRLAKIIEILKKNHQLSEECIDSAISSKEAKRYLKSTYYSLALIDMGLPFLNGDDADPFGGVKLLEVINSDSSIKTPGFVIGFTALVESLEEKVKAYKGKGFDLVQATRSDYSWLENSRPLINHLLGVFDKYERGNNKIAIFTVHGIRTYGNWQERLTDIYKSDALFSSASYFNYKNTHISTRAFCSLTKREEIQKDFDSTFENWLSSNRSRRIICIAHSFGSYLLINSLKKIKEKSLIKELDLIILCGSVLPKNYDFGFLSENKQITVLNECAIHDYALVINEAFVPDSGLGGILGFNGIQSSSFNNRYHLGGHSCFFKNDFMLNNWLPILKDKANIKLINDGDKQRILFSLLIKLSQKIRSFLKIKNTN